jgi:hypothetical protein
LTSEEQWRNSERGKQDGPSIASAPTGSGVPRAAGPERTGAHAKTDRTLGAAVEPELPDYGATAPEMPLVAE